MAIPASGVLLTLSTRLAEICSTAETAVAYASTLLTSYSADRTLPEIVNLDIGILAEATSGMAWDFLRAWTCVSGIAGFAWEYLPLRVYLVRRTVGIYNRDGKLFVVEGMMDVGV